MFYDFELGRASYNAPGETLEGDISLKRQFRIWEGRMGYMLESSLNIHDEILQQELGKVSDDKMKHIVATIQRDQNTIIRNKSSNVLIIQGVAGSGKTSIALHRIAFLLYRFRETISSKDILIISPNRVFADYMKLTKSYRSTYEITGFAQKIMPDKEIEIIERHGDTPVITECKSKEAQTEMVKKEIACFPQSGFNSLGIICKTQKQAGRYFETLKEDFPGIFLLTSESMSFKNGVIITSVHMDKGLEFDQVIILGADSKNYHRTIDRGLLYVACTRAMHKLNVFYTHDCSDFLP